MPIPHIFHNIWYDFGNGTSPPPKYLKYIEEWKKFHPDAEFMFWDMEKSQKLLRDHYPEYLDFFNNYKRIIYQVDVIRFFILHKYGGAYLDMDLQCKKNIYPLLDNNKVLIAKDGYALFQFLSNYFMASEPGNPFWKAAMDESVEKQKTFVHSETPSTLGVCYITGPLFLYQVYLSYLKKEDITLLQLYCINNVVSNDYMIHHYDGNWHNKGCILDGARILTIIFIILLFILLLLMMMN